MNEFLNRGFNRNINGRIFIFAKYLNGESNEFLNSLHKIKWLNRLFHNLVMDEICILWRELRWMESWIDRW